MSDRLFPRCEPHMSLLTALRRAKLRLCRSMHECCLRDDTIQFGQFYYDKGIRLRAHRDCGADGLRAVTGIDVPC